MAQRFLFLWAITIHRWQDLAPPTRDGLLTACRPHIKAGQSSTTPWASRVSQSTGRDRSSVNLHRNAQTAGRDGPFCGDGTENVAIWKFFQTRRLTRAALVAQYASRGDQLTQTEGTAWDSFRARMEWRASGWPSHSSPSRVAPVPSANSVLSRPSGLPQALPNP